VPDKIGFIIPAMPKRDIPRLLFCIAAATLGLTSFLHGADTPRPKITGIDHVAFYSSAPEAAKKFYGDLLGLPSGPWAGVYVVGNQNVEMEKDSDRKDVNRIAHVAFATDNAENMRTYLAEKGVTVPATVHHEKSGTQWFTLKDPEGHEIEFVQSAPFKPADASREISTNMIHAGFVVNDRAKMDKFYSGVLGFRLYWQGGMKDDRMDWVDMQVPEGAQWLEYMMQPAGAKLDSNVLGILNHIALGVTDIHAAAKVLESRGWKPSEREQAQLGKDGKWQLNLYDPDGTRVELMEFTPVKEPCCSKYLLPHPHEVAGETKQ
jgi:catechol 2,3-dioxygenase-like lactoylglutathione lyase family enzyme